MNLSQHLNNRQLEAASAIEGPLLIIAGAGSGKTKMITYRMAHMLEQGILQSQILALTFTNKAAKEMADRVRAATGKRLTSLTVSTFHAFGVKVLRDKGRLLGYHDNFSIYDQVDRGELIREVARELAIPRETLDISKVGNLFSGIKGERRAWGEEAKQYTALFNEYQAHLKAYNAVDFDDLILLPIRIFEEHPAALEEYRERFHYVMVDEFQDTSLAQYKLVRLLGETHRNLCVVGDDDQSIYSWRGANYQNIVSFERDFPERREIKLEQNYRSTKQILQAANSLIAHNKDRKQKELWTGIEGGKAIELFFPENEVEEARFIAEMIRASMLRERLTYDDFGILVRTNGLTSAIEEALLAENIPYRISGGTSFFQRKEVKDVISYLRVLANPDDDVNLLRVINTPRRGLGRRFLETMRELADRKSCSLYTALSAARYAADSPLSAKSVAEVGDFLSMLDHYRERLLSRGRMAESVKSLVDTLDYWGFLVAEYQKNEKVARWKFGNITRFIEMIERWERDPDTEDPSLFSFLNRITLITRDDDADDDERGKVNLMTIHAAKGLEFEMVFVAGVEENIIPHLRAVEEGNTEEERRLFYVAITRAKQKLYLTACRKRKLLRDWIEASPSPFLQELPEGLVEQHIPPKEVDAEEAKDYFAALKARLR